MKVYITTEEDGYNCDQVKIVYLNKEVAIRDVIKNVFRGSSYFDKLSESQLLSEAEYYIEEHEVNMEELC